MNTRIFTLLIAFLATLSGAVWGQGTTWTGEGTESNPYQISTVEDLKSLAESVNNGEPYEGKYFELTQDIDLEGSKENQWTPIGIYSEDAKPFSGIFDGGNNIISGLYINEESNGSEENEKVCFGLFGYIYLNAEIKNLTVKGEITAGGMIGGICGNASSGCKIENCCSEVDIKGIELRMPDVENSIEDGTPTEITANPPTLGIGGICGRISSLSMDDEVEESYIKLCKNKGTIIVEVFDINEFEPAEGTPEDIDFVLYNMVYVGGIVGWNSYNIISNSYNEGDITIEGSNNVVAYAIGGVCGFNQSFVQNCYNTGDISTENLSIADAEGDDNPIWSAAGLEFSYVALGGVVGQQGYLMGSKVVGEYIYNTGKISASSSTTSNYVGSICGKNSWIKTRPDAVGEIQNAYYLKAENLKGVGKDGDDEEEVVVTEKDQTAFESGEVAWLLRNAGGNYGQDIHSNTRAKTPTLLCFTPDDAVYKLTLDYSEYDGNGQTEKLVNSKYLDLPLLENSEEGKDAGWYDENGNLYTSESAIDDDVTLYAQIQTLRTITIEDTENGTIIADKEKAIVGETITLTAAPDEGYQLASITVTTGSGTTITVSPTGEKIYTFIMPDENVIVSAQFTKAEPPTDPDEGDEGDDIHHPQRPIKYYNIYVDTICPGLDVETSKDVVQEGHQVSAYLTIQAECDTTGMRFEYKRGLFGYWQDLKELEGVQPGEYIIRNIYTDIYIRALDATLPEEEPTGIDDLEGIQAYAKEGSIYVYTPNREEVTIVSMSGAILKHEEQVGWQSYAVNRGIYIVRIGEKVFKLKN